MKVEDVMSKNLICCDTSSNINEISKKMKENDVGLVLISENKKIIGIITDRDIVVNGIYNNLNNTKDIISKNVITISKDDSLEECALKLSKHKIKRIIVTDNKKIVGVISLSDIVGKIDNDLFVKTFSSIYEINRNDNKFNVDIDDFYL